jgi:RNA recognition motif-containing protein
MSDKLSKSLDEIHKDDDTSRPHRHHKRGIGKLHRHGHTRRLPYAKPESDKERRLSRERSDKEVKIVIRNDKKEISLKKKEDTSFRIEIANLQPNVESADLHDLFGKLGVVIKAEIVLTSDRKPSGIAYVWMASKAAAVSACKEYDGANIDGKPVSVHMKREFNDSVEKLEKSQPDRSQREPREPREPRPREPKIPRESSDRGRGRGGRGGGRGEKRPNLSLDDMEKELQGYMNKNE